jgi:hypothetical protein
MLLTTGNDGRVRRLQLLTGRTDPSALLLAAAQDQIKRSQGRVRAMLLKSEDTIKALLGAFSKCIAPPPPPSGDSKTDDTPESTPLSLERALGLLVTAAQKRKPEVHSIDGLIADLKDKEEPSGDAGGGGTSAAVKQADAELREAHGLVKAFCGAVRLAQNGGAIAGKLAETKAWLTKELNQWNALVRGLTQTVSAAQASSGLLKALSADEHATALANILDEVASLLAKLTPAEGNKPANKHDLKHRLLGALDGCALGDPEHHEYARGPLGLLTTLAEEVGCDAQTSPHTEDVA